MKELKDKRVLITGAGSGVGHELAVRFAAEGAEIIVTDRDPQGVKATTDLLKSRGCRASGYIMDVTDEQSVSLVRSRVNAEGGPIDVLVNNAGVVFGGSFLEVPIKDHQKTFEVNTVGPMLLTHVFLPDLIKNSSAHIVNIASASAMIALPFGATYASSKWAVLGFSESLREELRLQGHGHVRVTAICPSYISTNMFTGVKAPRLMPVLNPKRLADQVLKAVQKNKEQLLTPWLVKLIPLGRGLMMRGAFRKLCDLLHVSTGMRTWQRPASAPAASRRVEAPTPTANPPALSALRVTSKLEPQKELSVNDPYP